jgi:hypothetical protein
MEIHLRPLFRRFLAWITTALISFPALYCVAQVSSETGADMMPIAVTGFNRDLVVESNAVGPPYTNYASELDSGEGLAYYQTGLWQYAWGMPPSGTFVSLMGDRTIFQFQPYTNNNALVLNADTGLTNGTLYLTTPAAYARIAILANSGDGTNDTGSLTLHFSDGSSNVTTYFAPDWETGAENIAWFGPGRIDLVNGSDTTGPEEPSFYQTTVNIASLTGGTNKTLTSITFGKAIANSTAIYAISGLPAGDAPPPSFPVAATGWNRDLVIENTASGPPYNAYALEFIPKEGTAYQWHHHKSCRWVYFPVATLHWRQCLGDEQRNLRLPRNAHPVHAASL